MVERTSEQRLALAAEGEAKAAPATKGRWITGGVFESAMPSLHGSVFDEDANQVLQARAFVSDSFESSDPEALAQRTRNAEFAAWSREGVPALAAALREAENLAAKERAYRIALADRYCAECGQHKDVTLADTWKALKLAEQDLIDAGGRP